MEMAGEQPGALVLPSLSAVHTSFLEMRNDSRPDRYQVPTDKRSGITNDPNRPDDEQYILRLIGQVVTISLETAKIVRALPPLGLT
jgi:hypothetical protein